MKLRAISLSLLLAFTGLSYAQNKPITNYQLPKSNQCQQKSSLITDDQARDIGVALITNNILLLQHFISTYCLDSNSYSQNEEFNPIYLARSNDALKYLLATGIQPFSKLNDETKIDMLTFFMLEDEVNKHFLDTSGNFINSKLKELEIKLKIPNLNKNVPHISAEERRKIIATLLSEYKRNDYFHRDSLGNSISVYAIMASEPEILGKSLTLSPNLALFQKNKDGLSLFQIAMLPKHLTHLDSNKLKQKAINDFIVSNLNDKNIGMVRYEDLNYIDFASLLKDNNPELYQALISKFPAISPTRFNSMTDDEKNKAKAFFNNYDYVEKIKKLLEK